MIIRALMPLDTKTEIAKAVAIAALSALATKLVEWGVDELKKRARREAPKSEQEESPS
jgi:hypothetical protein